MPITATGIESLSGDGYKVDKKSCVTVRLIKVDIGGKEPEILVTSLLDKKKYPHKCFKGLYNLRWGCETSIEKLKNKFQIASFSGHLPQAVYQDFYVKIIMENIHQLLVNSNRNEVNKMNKDKRIKKAINNNVTIGILRKITPELFDKKRNRSVIAKLKKTFILYLEPVRPGRSFPRDFNKSRPRGKYYTLKNYRRAA